MLPQLGLLEMAVVMMVAVLLFGKRLPEVGRSLGKGIIEFKKGLNGLTDELDFSPSDLTRTSPRRSYDDHVAPVATQESDDAVPKFELPTTAPVAQDEVA